MRRRLLWVILLVVVGARADADEVLTSSTPVPAVREAPEHYVLTDLRVRTDPPRVDLRLVAMKADGDCAMGDHGECQSLAVAYTGSEALMMINALNTANLSTKSLRRRILERLQADGVVPVGTITGAAGLPTWTATPSATATSVPATAATATP